eukprot:4931394-Pleurochrysis_carterae.AAC.1
MPLRSRLLTSSRVRAPAYLLWRAPRAPCDAVGPARVRQVPFVCRGSGRGATVCCGRPRLCNESPLSRGVEADRSASLVGTVV